MKVDKMRDEISELAGRSMVDQLDTEIQSIVGTTWTAAELKRRCRLEKVAGLPFETLLVDGVPRLEIYPIEVTQEQCNDSFIIRATQQMRRLSVGEKH